MKQSRDRLIKDILNAKHLSKQDKYSIIDKILDKFNEKGKKK